MGWVRFGGRIGVLFLALAAVASLAIASDAADRRHRDARVQHVARGADGWPARRRQIQVWRVRPQLTLFRWK
jgi:hypothetical protein